MTPEQRLDRLERIAKLFVKAGLRARHNMRELDEKMNIMIDAHIQNEERFAKFDERFAKSDERFARFEELLTKSDERFIKFEAQTDQTLKALIELVRQRRDGS